jgi:hypothetical protein
MAAGALRIRDRKAAFGRVHCTKPNAPGSRTVHG